MVNVWNLSAVSAHAGKAHWELLLKARAVETQCFVIAAAQAGKHNEKRESFGDSIIVDPWGDIIGRLDDPLATGIAVAELDFDKMRKVRICMENDCECLWLRAGQSAALLPRQQSSQRHVSNCSFGSVGRRHPAC